MNRKTAGTKLWTIGRTGLYALLALMLCAGAILPTPAAAADARRQVNFDHLKTGFPLTGAHVTTQCETCHVRGVFRGTPTQCANCHTPGSRIATTVKSARHIPTSAPCDQCHTSTTMWEGVRFSHATIAPGSCTTCHNNSIVPGKPGKHVQTMAACDTCHRTTAWTPAAFNHGNVTPGSCASCHYNGGPGAGKPGNHVQTTASCDTCHRTTAWIPASFSHANVTPGGCASCHYAGGPATGKPGNHVQTTASCDTCHRTTAWTPASFSHASVTPGSCSTQCHNGSGQGMAKPSGHFVTARSCDACHHSTATGGFALPMTYSHTTPYYKSHNAPINSNCNGCHTGNNEVITWQYAAYKPDCAGCHAGRFKPDSHKKTESPTTVLYTVSELKDCSGSCHLYTNNAFTIIKTNRSGQHKPTDGGF